MTNAYFRLFDVIRHHAERKNVVVYNCVESIDGTKFAVIASHTDVGTGDATLDWTRKKILLDLLRDMDVGEREILYDSLEAAIRAHEEEFF